MRDHTETVISHIVEIGHGEESKVRPRLESSIVQAEQFLRQKVLSIALELVYYLLNHTGIYHYFHGREFLLIHL